MTYLSNNSSVLDLVLKHAGRAGVALGGAPSLRRDMVILNGVDAVKISANEHGVMFTSCDYITVLDSCNIPPIKPFHEAGTPVISHGFWSDYRMFSYPVNNAGCVAAFLLYALGCAPVILAGMGCYEGGGTYWHDHKAHSGGNGSSVEQHLMKWQTLADKTPGAMFRSVTGPLTKLFPMYDKNEPARTPDRDGILEVLGARRVRFVRTIEKMHAPHVYQKDDVATVHVEEARKLINHRAAVLL